MIIGVCTLELSLPEPASLKEKRSVIKAICNRLHREFNVSAAEVGYHDAWQSALLGVTLVATDAGYVQTRLHGLAAWLENARPDIDVVGARVELIPYSHDSAD
jgi:uncharacterized protein YlxP (DUF503 family)